MKKFHNWLILVFFCSYAMTFLPNFGVMNEARFIGPLPEPMLFVLVMNAINTFMIFVIYKFIYPYYCRSCEKELNKGGAE